MVKLADKIGRGRNRRTSRYLTMRDGVRIAVDVWLPAGLAPPQRIPAIVHQTRYFRAIDWALPLRWLGVPEFLDINATTRQAMLAAGYAWIDVDVRGSGASFGSRPSPWWHDEVADGAEVVDWIIAQPWSSGLVGATGVSYGGTCAEFLLRNRHPAVRAVVPRFSLFDVYTDVAFPGGIQLAWFTAAWSSFNRALDRNTYPDAFAAMVRVNLAAAAELFADRGRARAARVSSALDRDDCSRWLARLVKLANSGVRPTDGDRRGELVRAAVRDHGDNIDVHAGALRMVFRDDAGMAEIDPDATIDIFSPHHYVDAIAGSGAAVYNYSGWLDGAYEHAAIKRHLNLAAGQSKLILGPWDHGGRHDISPFSADGKVRFDHDGEMLRFFDHHLKGIANGVMDEAPVRYYTIGSECWQSAASWPPPHRPLRWYFGAGGELLSARPGEAGARVYRVDPDLGTGKRSRWRSLVGLTVLLGYGDRAVADRRMLCYTSPPLSDDLEVTGHPIIRLWVSSDHDDGTFFVYLEDVAPEGRVTYVTEGQLRGLHRQLGQGRPPYLSAVPYRSFLRADAAPLQAGEVAELVFDLLPISYLFRRGHALRVAVAGADSDHFMSVTASVPTIRLHHGGAVASAIELPVAVGDG